MPQNNIILAVVFTRNASY